MSGRRAIVFGEAVIDRYPQGPVVAGSPLHVAAHLAAMGWRSMLITRLGRDEGGRAILSALERFGVGTSLVELDDRLPTGEVTVETGETDNRFTIHGPAAWDAISGPPNTPECEAVCYGSLSGRSQESLQSLRRLLASASGALKTFDVNLRPPDVDRAVLELCLANATMVKLTGEELARTAGELEIAGSTRAFFDFSPGLEWLCITKGERGAELHRRSGEVWTEPGAQVEVVDTVGAGDAFTAGLIDGLIAGGDGSRALKRASEAAAGSLGERGGLPKNMRWPVRVVSIDGGRKQSQEPCDQEVPCATKD